MTTQHTDPDEPDRSAWRLPTNRGRTLPEALILIAVFGVLLGLLEIGLGLAAPELLWATASFVAVVWIWIAAGLIAWWRRPHNRTGALLVVGGVALFLAGLGNVQIEVLSIVSYIFATSPLAATVQLLLAFPSGRLRGRLSVVTVVLAWVVCVGVQFVRFVISPDRPEAFFIVTTLQQVLGIATMVLTAIVLARRLFEADRQHRRILLPLFSFGIVAVLALALAGTITRSFGLDPDVTGVVQLIVSAGIPIAFLLGVLLGRFIPTRDLEPLSAWLGVGGASRPAVARALARTLGDESLRVFYWSEEQGDYVDELGAPVGPDQRTPDRGWHEIRIDSRLVGAIVYDTRLIADPEPVRLAGDVLALAVDRERLTTQLLASNDALVQSRIRIVETADRERSRIAQDLHDGIQVQLVLLALAAQTIANSADATPGTSDASAALRRGIDEAAADLRRLVHNVLPVALMERGLTAAAEDLVDRLAVAATLDAELDDDRITPTTAHTAYFIIAEALANTVKHSRASSVRVTLRNDDRRLTIDVHDNGVGGASMSQGAGLRSLVDRVDALGGKLEIHSPRGRGTRVSVELPCA